jgi:hypothetical protein
MTHLAAELARLPEPVRDLALDVAALFETLDLGHYVLAISGSTSKGTWVRDRSDIDFRPYLGAELPPDDIGPRLIEPFEAVADRWRAKGFLIDGIGPLQISWVESWLDAWLAGSIEAPDFVWTLWGYRPMPDILNMVAVAGDLDLVARWRERAARYPDAAQEAVYARYRPALTYWPGDYHYRNKVGKGDVVFLHGVTDTLVHAIAEVLCARNRRWFTGDGNLLRTLDALEVKPEACTDRIRAILYPAPGEDRFALQREDLCALAAETLALIEHPG